MSERMPLARQLLANGKMSNDVVLFDVQVAHDLLSAKGKYDMTSLGPVHMPFPELFMEWDLKDLPDEPFTAEDLTEDLVKVGVTLETLLAQNNYIIEKVGVRVMQGIDCIGIRPYLFDDHGEVTEYMLGMLVGIKADGMMDGKVCYHEFGKVHPYHEPRKEAIMESLQPTARAATTVTLIALSLINCKNVATEMLGQIKMRRSGRQKRQGIPPVAVRYHTIMLPGGGSHRVGEGSGAHHRPTVLHMVRGHTKTFTAERPLLGKHVGTYWWGWQTRGDPDQGVIVSDYQLAAGEQS